MQFRLSAPSKTFLSGEYVVTQGEPGLVLLTEPRFKLNVFIDSPNAESQNLIGIHPLSPAGQWVSDHTADFASGQFEFIDPHEGRGGFGASTAQFLLVYLWSCLSKKSIESLEKNTDSLAPSFCTKDLWLSYMKYNSQKGVRPSGIDVVAQSEGQLVVYGHQTKEPLQYVWPFQEMAFHVFHTGNKVATHTHLASLELPDLTALTQSNRHVLESFSQKDSQKFIASIGEYKKELHRLGLTDDRSWQLLNRIESVEGVVTAKACGALGSDTIVIFCRPEHSQKVKNDILALKQQQSHLHWVADESCISSGWSINV